MGGVNLPTQTSARARGGLRNQSSGNYLPVWTVTKRDPTNKWQISARGISVSSVAVQVTEPILTPGVSHKWEKVNYLQAGVVSTRQRTNCRPAQVSGGCGSQGDPCLVGRVLCLAQQVESPKLCCRQRASSIAGVCASIVSVLVLKILVCVLDLL